MNPSDSAHTDNPGKPPKTIGTGRFAPSPSGSLHFGSLVAALGSYLIARSSGNRWLVRMEDLDPPREVAGAADDILRTLEGFGLHWDSEVEYQSQHLERFDAALETLASASRVYRCSCTRKQIAAMGGIYDNRCRALIDQAETLSSEQLYALRFRNHQPITRFTDGIQGFCEFPELATEDFVVRRRDQLHAYQLAVVVDDIKQGIGHVVRGCDLLDSTVRQLNLLYALGAPAPRYYHLPVAAATPGNKLSKQNHAAPVRVEHALEHLLDALKFLGQPTPSDLLEANLANDLTAEELLAFAVAKFDLGAIPARQEIVWPAAEN